MASSSEALRQTIAERSRSAIVPAILSKMADHHKREWKTCPCTWCATKREATSRIGLAGLMVPTVRSHADVENRRNCLRDLYRARLTEAFDATFWD